MRPSGSRIRAEPRDEACEHLLHELGESGTREPIVERLVGDGDVVLVIELAQQIRERLDRRAGEHSDDGQEQPVRRHHPQAFALPRRATELVADFHRESARKRVAHSGKVRARQRSLGFVGVETTI